MSMSLADRWIVFHVLLSVLVSLAATCATRAQEGDGARSSDVTEPASDESVGSDEVYWVNPAGGLFGEGSNWTGGSAPGSLDAAIFSLGS